MLPVDAAPPLFFKTVARVVIVATLCGATLVGIAGCGQRGPLYYPDANNPDRRR